MSEHPDHYFSAEPSTPEERQTIRVRLQDVEHRLTTARGVYSPDRLDPGTAVLLAHVPDPSPVGTLLDIGCGWGPLSIVLGSRSPGAAVWGVDVNRRALALAQENARSVGLSNVTFAEPDEVPDDLRFDTIWSNPPIHVGKAALHALLLRWLPRLTEDGVAHLVVQKHLGSDSLQRWITEQSDPEQGWALSCTRLASQRGFRVLEVRRTA